MTAVVFWEIVLRITHIDVKGLEPAASHGILTCGQAIAALALAIQYQMRYHATRTNFLM